jgi:hypothetical protein
MAGRPKKKKSALAPKQRLFSIRIDEEIDARLTEAAKYTHITKGAILSACLRNVLDIPTDSPVVEFVKRFTNNCPWKGVENDVLKCTMPEGECHD